MVNNIFHLDYKYLLDEFGEEKISKRYESIYSYLEGYIERHKLNKQVIISKGLLNQTIIDYFVDIFRLKEFHNIEKVNPTKIHAYSAYWLLKRKPLQLIDSETNSPGLMFVNERFVSGYLVRFLTKSDFNVSILEERKQEYIEFIDNLMYFCQYRVSTPQMIETMLCSFQAGRSLQFSIDFQE